MQKNKSTLIEKKEKFVGIDDSGLLPDASEIEGNIELEKDMTTVSMPTCFVCKNYDNSDIRKNICNAYPNGIPEAILHSEHDHRKPFSKEKKRDKEPILFEPRNKEATEYAEELFDRGKE